MRVSSILASLLLPSAIISTPQPSPVETQISSTSASPQLPRNISSIPEHSPTKTKSKKRISSTSTKPETTSTSAPPRHNPPMFFSSTKVSSTSSTSASLQTPTNITRAQEASAPKIKLSSILVSLQRVLENGASVQICEGTLISNFQFLTAAHCFDENLLLRDMVARIGSDFQNKGGGLYGFSYADIHPNYLHANDTLQNDLAVVTLLSPLDKAVPWLQLAQPNSLPQEASTMEIIGWDLLASEQAPPPPGESLTRSETLNTTVRDPKTCVVLGTSFDTSPQTCSSSLRSPGEAHWTGGPVVHYNVVGGQPRIVGIVSYWNSFGKESFAFHSRLSSYVDWITSVRNARYSRPHPGLLDGPGEFCTKVVGYDWRNFPVTEPC